MPERTRRSGCWAASADYRPTPSATCPAERVPAATSDTMAEYVFLANLKVEHH